VPLYTYLCDDCGASLEVLHGIGKTKELCGLDCRLQGAGAFGKGRIIQQLDAANVAAKPKSLRPSALSESFADVRREALRQKGLRKLGGELSERDLDTLRDKGLTVYRKDGHQNWSKDGGDESAPTTINPDGGKS